MLFIENLWENPLYFAVASVVVVFSICLHEYCHARVALWMGDSTVADHGYLTLNPLQQMGPASLIMFLFLGFAWGAVPVNPANLRRKHKWGELAVGLAGPAANFLLLAVCWILLFFFGRYFNGYIVDALFLMGISNFILMSFNLLPVPGLDGWSVVRALFPNMRMPADEVVKGIMVVLIFGALMGVGYIRVAGIWIMVQAGVLGL